MGYSLEKLRSLAYKPIISTGASMSSLAESRPARDWLLLLVVIFLIGVAGAVFGGALFFQVQNADYSEEIVEGKTTSLTRKEVTDAVALRRAVTAEFERLRTAPPDIVDPSL